MGAVVGDGGGRRRQPHVSMGGAAMDALNLRPCLVHVPSGAVVKSFVQLSKIVKAMGWKVFIDVTANVWSAWHLPAGDGCLIQMVFLPHPHLSAATHFQLSVLVQALGQSLFNISCAPLRKFRDFAPRALALGDDAPKPLLRVKASGRKIFSVRALAQVLLQHGWSQDGDCHFSRRDSGDRCPAHLQIVSVMKLPPVDYILQLSLLDLEYIVMVSDNLFYLQSAFQQPRKRDKNTRERKSAPANPVKKVTADSKTTPKVAVQKVTADSHPPSCESTNSTTTTATSS
ncbi:hypothetical protein MPTK1_7g10050 [Marchantia polymorpha subsp. ruderalis]|uniref:Uncharacterized protein n=2 Tax=Marchantia polymorpha TaxID=3197 RepID=A0A176WK35_MARPO|nr:hypothetical protein AXG93_2852s1280 [Marchantia polymorpha subsp. ruderalis]PTQ49116.1 hypothetical protein MARPO_0003s0024 [Marchantia polymorpha]BBN16876.1 hypothetical protein Mp_7g10050 [Marchantia polymorpha subsp. ruderalis]|eukprot:PTQ49116.1 hypothetical protein MARPO_0003s0024 [Marchantia polymorpha]